MRKFWWTLSDTKQRFIVIFGGIFAFLSIMLVYPIVVHSPGIYGLYFIMSTVVLFTLTIIHGIDKWCFDPYKNVEVVINDGVGPYSYYISARAVNNQIKNLLDCLETDFWVRLMNEVFQDHTYLINANHDDITTQSFAPSLTHRMLAYEDYLRHEHDPPEWYPKQGSAEDMSYREMFESSIASYFAALPVGLAKMYIRRLGKDDTPEGLWAAINNEMLWTHGHMP